MTVNHTTVVNLHLSKSLVLWEVQCDDVHGPKQREDTLFLLAAQQKNEVSHLIQCSSNNLFIFNNQYYMSYVYMFNFELAQSSSEGLYLIKQEATKARKYTVLF